MNSSIINEADIETSDPSPQKTTYLPPKWMQSEARVQTIIANFHNTCYFLNLQHPVFTSKCVICWKSTMHETIKCLRIANPLAVAVEICSHHSDSYGPITLRLIAATISIKQQLQNSLRWGVCCSFPRDVKPVQNKSVTSHIKLSAQPQGIPEKESFSEWWRSWSMSYKK